MPALARAVLYLRSSLFYPVLYINWALFLILGSWLLLGRADGPWRGLPHMDALRFGCSR